ncbi:MAG TPA: phophatidylserine decarboxylase associated domain-containing protein [Pyrinomonadaceae bacterium]|nr:phophatidylserine decarboxylase associated domain-containing protein [Pyrinomonadaceae bacterium]
MNQEAKKAIDARYENHFGYIAGYLPRDRAAVDEWQKNLKRELQETREKGVRKKKRSPAVKALEELIALDGIVRMYVSQMLEQQPSEHNNISTIDELLDALDYIVTLAPRYNADPNKRHAFPMSELFTYMMMTQAGEAVFRNVAFNSALRVVLQEWCAFLDSPKSASVLNEGEDGWLSQSAYWFNRLFEFEIPNQKAPHWGWKSYNDYFHREIKAEARPIADPGDPTVIVSANDGKVYNIASNVLATDSFWLKGQPYSLVNMLNNRYVERFVGGSVFQSFLSGADYHRWRAPIEGVVRRAEIVDGLMFSDLEAAGYDPTAATYSQGYEASVNTRGLVFIESPRRNIGMVCVIPIGITEISSVTITVEEGQKVKKGDELGYFSYGGSSMCLVFQPGAIDRFTVPNRPSGNNPDDGPPIRVNSQIAVGR